MTKKPELGVIKRVNLRDIWNNEPQEFTPWLEEHIALLGEVLKMEDLEVKAREVSVGSLKVDLLATSSISDTNDETNQLVVIENQLGGSDHSHLGKLLTYAAGCDAAAIVWVANEFTDYHKETLDWLNQNFEGRIKCFGVQIEALKIDNSRPAPNFDLVIMPNEWERDMKRTVQKLGIKDRRYQAFFQDLLDELYEMGICESRSPTPPFYREFFLSVHGGQFRYCLRFTKYREVCVDVWIDRRRDVRSNKAVFDEMFQRKNAIEKQLQGSGIRWERLDENIMSRISLHREGSIEDDESKLDEIRQWMVERLGMIRETFNRNLDEYELDEA